MKKRLVVVLMMVCILLTACGNLRLTAGDNASETMNSSQQESADSEMVWAIDEIKIPDADAALDTAMGDSDSRDEMYFGMAGETIYRYVQQYNEENFITHYFVQQLDAPYTEWQTQVIVLEEEGQTMRRQVKDLKTLTPNGDLYFLYDYEGMCYRERISVEQGYSLDVLTADGMNEIFETADRWYIHEGKDFIYTPDGMRCYQNNFTMVENIEQQNMGTIYDSVETVTKDNLYLYGWTKDNSGLYLWNAEQREPVLVTDIIGVSPKSAMAFYSDTEGYLCDTEGVWEFSVTDGTVNQVMLFIDQGIYIDDVCGATGREDGSMLLLVQNDSEYFLLNRVQKAVSEVKTVLELAVVYADTFLKESVVRFNQQSQNYKIVLSERPADVYYNDYCVRIQAEVSGGGGPDLLAADILDFEDSVEKGYFRNLTEDFKAQKAEMIKSAWNNGTVKGEQYAIPYSFQVHTIEVGKDTVGDVSSWTLQELMQITRESGVEFFANGMDGPGIFYYLGIMNESNSRLVDWEQEKCNLNGSEALELLEFAKEYASKMYYIDDTSLFSDEILSPEERILQGEVLALESAIMYIQDLQRDEIFYQLRETEKVYIGYPVENGESQHKMRCSQLVVNQTCKHPEGAIEFLRFLTSEETQGRIVENQTEMKCGFPVRSDSLDLMLEKAMQGYYDDSSMNSYLFCDEEFPAQPISPQSVQKLREVIETASPYSNRTSALYTLITEETAAYFAGDKSAQEVLDILQNRVQLYLDEMN